MAGCDEKSNIQVGDVKPPADTPGQSNRAIVWAGTSVQEFYHDYGIVANIVTSVIRNMNQYKNIVNHYTVEFLMEQVYLCVVTWCNIWSIFGI